MIFGLFGQLSSIWDAATKHKTAYEQAFIKILTMSTPDHPFLFVTYIYTLFTGSHYYT